MALESEDPDDPVDGALIDGVIVEGTPVMVGPGPQRRRGLYQRPDEEIHGHQPMAPLGRPIRVKDGL